MNEFANVCILVGLFLFAFLISTFLIRKCIPNLQTDSTEKNTNGENNDSIIVLPDGQKLPESSSTNLLDFKSTGFWIGLCETFLIFVLVLADAFNALAIIIGAKQFVRNEKIKQNPSYYLLGTLTNLCVSILFAQVASWVLGSSTDASAISIDCP